MSIVPFVIVSSVAFLATGIGHGNGVDDRKKEGRMQQELRVQLNVKNAGDHLQVEYEFENVSGRPVLVFDRLWDMRANAMAPNWAYVELHGPRAVIKRTLDRMPEGLQHENPPVPYGREIAGNGRGDGKFSLPLPLHSRGEYEGMGPRHAMIEQEALHEVSFALGWCPKPDHLPPAIHPVTMNNETLYLLPYELVAQLQRVATSGSVKLP